MYRLINLALYPAFVGSADFKSACSQIENEIVRDAVLAHGIGDSLERHNDRIRYDFEAGNLLEPEVQDLLRDLSDEDYDNSFNAIGNLAERYAEWANSVEVLLDKVFQLNNRIENLRAFCFDSPLEEIKAKRGS